MKLDTFLVWGVTSTKISISLHYNNNNEPSESIKTKNFCVISQFAWMDLSKFHITISCKNHYTDEPKSWNVNPPTYRLNMRFFFVYNIHSTDELPPNDNNNKYSDDVSSRFLTKWNFRVAVFFIFFLFVLLHLYNVLNMRKKSHVSGIFPPNDINPYSLIERISSTRTKSLRKPAS